MNKKIPVLPVLLGLLLLHGASARAADQEQAAQQDAQPVASLPEVRVSAEKEGTADSGYRNATATTGPLGKLPLQDTPYSLNVTSGELFENRSAHTVSDALRTNPTVSTLMESSGYTTMSRVMVRGFTAADQSDARDGLVDRSFSFVPLENVDRIEVLNGFSGFLYGFSALGGTVNYVSKQPTATPYASVAGGVYGGGIGYLHGDFGGMAGDDDCWGYRVNIYDEHGGSYIEGNQQNRQLASAVVTFKASADTKLWADLWDQEVEMTGLATYMDIYKEGSGNSAVSYVPDASRFDARTQYGQDWTYNRAHKTLMGVGAESALTDALTLRAAYRFGDMWRDYQYVYAKLTSRAADSYTEQAVGSTVQTEQTRSAYALLDANFNTWSVSHKLTFGYTGTSFFYTRGADVKQNLGTSSVDDPASFSDPHLSIGPTTQASTTYYDNWVAGDIIGLTEQWSALVGINRATLKTETQSQTKPTPSVALMFKPVPMLTIYASYMEALASGGTAPATAANANEVLAPSASDQEELGVKASYGGMDWTFALFRLNKINEYTDPSDNVYKQEGREVHQGLEFTATGKPASRLTLIGGFTVQDAHTEKAANNPALEGKILVNVPEQLARLYAEYAFADAPGLVLTGGPNYFGRRPVDNMNTAFVDEATIWDLGLRYLTRAGGHKLTLIGNLANVFDASYWSYYRSGDGLLLGAPRTLSATAKLEF